MRLRLALATTGASVALVLGTGAGVAHAQDYPGGTTKERVEASQADRPSAVLGEVESRDVAPAAVEAEAANNALLPFTGGDYAGITVLGVGLIGVGTVLVRRSRRTTAEA
jgi:hypothetical protein